MKRSADLPVFDVTAGTPIANRNHEIADFSPADMYATPPVCGAALIAKLGHHLELDAGERRALTALLTQNVRRLQHRAVLVEAGSSPAEISVMVDGWACRVAVLPDGARRIVAFYLPGDVCDFDVFLMHTMDQAIVAIGDVRVAGINRADLNTLAREQPRISQCLWWESLVAAACQRAWTINAGHSSARRRLAHLLCELRTRLSLVGLGDPDACPFPATQHDLGAACGLTPVHVNRTLRIFRDDGLADVRDGRLVVHDYQALAELAQFDPSYLQVRALANDRAGNLPSRAFMCGASSADPARYDPRDGSPDKGNGHADHRTDYTRTK